MTKTHKQLITFLNVFWNFESTSRWHPAYAQSFQIFAHNWFKSINYFFLMDYSPILEFSPHHLFFLPPLYIVNVNSFKTTLIFPPPIHFIKEPHQPQDGRHVCLLHPVSSAGGLDCIPQNVVFYWSCGSITLLSGQTVGLEGFCLIYLYVSAWTSVLEHWDIY